jgi:hypothetical protein
VKTAIGIQNGNIVKVTHLLSSDHQITTVTYYLNIINSNLIKVKAVIKKINSEQSADMTATRVP